MVYFTGKTLFFSVRFCEPLFSGKSISGTEASRAGSEVLSLGFSQLAKNSNDLHPSHSSLLLLPVTERPLAVQIPGTSEINFDIK